MDLFCNKYQGNTNHYNGHHSPWLLHVGMDVLLSYFDYKMSSRRNKEGDEICEKNRKVAEEDA